MEERRKFVRLPSRLIAEYTILNSAKRYSAITRNASAISSVVCSPHFTRTGGWAGFRGLLSELSNVYSRSTLVFFGSAMGLSYR